MKTVMQWLVCCFTHTDNAVKYAGDQVILYYCFQCKRRWR